MSDEQELPTNSKQRFRLLITLFTILSITFLVDTRDGLYAEAAGR
jgi:hypothetical protein